MCLPPDCIGMNLSPSSPAADVYDLISRLELCCYSTYGIHAVVACLRLKTTCIVLYCT